MGFNNSFSQIHAPFSSFSRAKISPIETSPRAFLNASTMLSTVYSPSMKSARRNSNNPSKSALPVGSKPITSPNVTSPNDSARLDINALTKTSASKPSSWPASSLPTSIPRRASNIAISPSSTPTISRIIPTFTSPIRSLTILMGSSFSKTVAKSKLART